MAFNISAEGQNYENSNKSSFLKNILPAMPVEVRKEEWKPLQRINALVSGKAYKNLISGLVNICRLDFFHFYKIP